jgi:hypothetical protein
MVVIPIIIGTAVIWMRFSPVQETVAFMARKVARRAIGAQVWIGLTRRVMTGLTLFKGRPGSSVALREGGSNHGRCN